MPEDANSRYLKELLKQADRANEQARLYERTKITDSVKISEASAVKKAEEPTDTKHPAGKISDEAAQIISVYSSGKEKERPFSNTQRLRDSLAAGMQENKELLG